MDSTLKSNLSVGLPLDLLVYEAGALRAPTRSSASTSSNPYFQMIRSSWGQRLREVFESHRRPALGRRRRGAARCCVPSGRYEPMSKITHPARRSSRATGARPASSSARDRADVVAAAPHLTVFGEWRISRGEREVPVPVRKALASFVFLALEGRSTRARLAAMFWSGLDEPAARRNLRHALHRLRSAGLGDALIAEDEHVALAGVGKRSAWLRSSRGPRAGSTRRYALRTGALLRRRRGRGRAGVRRLAAGPSRAFPARLARAGVRTRPAARGRGRSARRPRGASPVAR